MAFPSPNLFYDKPTMVFCEITYRNSSGRRADDINTLHG